MKQKQSLFTLSLIISSHSVKTVTSISIFATALFALLTPAYGEVQEPNTQTERSIDILFVVDRSPWFLPDGTSTYNDTEAIEAIRRDIKDMGQMQGLEDEEQKALLWERIEKMNSNATLCNYEQITPEKSGTANFSGEKPSWEVTGCKNEPGSEATLPTDTTQTNALQELHEALNNTNSTFFRPHAYFLIPVIQESPDGNYISFFPITGENGPDNGVHNPNNRRKRSR